MLAAASGGSLDASADGRRLVRRKPSTNKEADVEETIGYEALFSAEEWDAMNFGDWDPELKEAVQRWKS